MSIEPSPIEAGWHWVLNCEDDRNIVAIAAAASRVPVLRSLYPFPSHSNLRFSTKTEYPYDAHLPYVLTTPQNEYEARDGDGATLTSGTLDEVVAAVAKRMSEVLASAK